MNRPIATLALVAALAACGGEGSPTEPEDVTFDPSLGINLSQMTRLESGVYIQTITPGTGTQELRVQDWMAAHYKFWIPNGTLVQDSRQTGQPYNEYAFNSVEGWALGVVGMKVGEVRRIVIPSRLGYGANPPNDAIPKNSVLIYEVQLASIG
jgi:peptidylprolyl isomerase